MATKTTQYLSSSRLQDCVKIDVVPEDYEEKWGVIKVNVTSVTYTNGGLGTIIENGGRIDLRNTNYAQDYDNVLIDNQLLTNTVGTITVNKSYYFAVNNGNIPPSAIYDSATNRWDLLALKYTLPTGTALFDQRATITYTVTFTDLTPVSNPAGDTLNLSITEFRQQDTVQIGVVPVSSEFASNESGYCTLQLCSLAHNVNPANQVVEAAGIMNIVNATFLFNYAEYVEKYSFKKVFEKHFFVVAVNNQKFDANCIYNKVAGQSDSAIILSAVLTGQWYIALITSTLEYKLTAFNYPIGD